LNSDLFKYSRTSEKWKEIGVNKRAGVALPLFSVYSSKSTGIGEIPDIRYLIDWCTLTGLSILQLLPLNETGFDNSPYSAVSTFAVDPVYICIKRLRKTDLVPFRRKLRDLKRNYPKNNIKVDYGIRKEKLGLLREIFDSGSFSGSEKFDGFISGNIHWLKYYAIYKIISNHFPGKNWTEWDLKFRYLPSASAEKILRENSEDVRFYYWVQWQLYEQLVTIRKYAKSRKVYLMGDIPFLVSRNSADVWAYKNYFKLDVSSGAPPDMYFAKGQRWGMPPYNWFNIAADNYGYIKQRMAYAQNFYDMFRIDHFVGLFRLWTIDNSIPPEEGGLLGRFDPENESEWEQHGRIILSVINDSTDMLPCAEDLGTVPECSDKVLEEFGITGINVQRWERKKNENYNFRSPQSYRINSVSVISTHDSSSFPSWYLNEAGSTDEESFRMFFRKKGYSEDQISYLKKKLFTAEEAAGGRLFWRRDISNVFKLLNLIELPYDKAAEFVEQYLSSYGERTKFRRYIGYEKPSGNPEEKSVDTEFIKKSLEKILSCSSIFSIQLLQEYLYLNKNFLKNHSGPGYRINSPGTVNDDNWTMRIHISLDDLLNSDVNNTLKKIISDSGRSGNN